MLLACIGFEQMGLVVHGEIGNLFGPLSWIVWASLGGESELFDHSRFDQSDQFDQFRKLTNLTSFES